MDDDIPEDLSLSEQVQIMIDDLPAPIQDFINSPERDQVSLQLSKKYGLHADAASIFERSYIFMLLGVFTPDDFVQELRKNEFDENVIRSLAADVNEQVFKKLRAREQEESSVSEAQIRPEPSVPMMGVGQSPSPERVLPGQETQLNTAVQKSTISPVPNAAPIYSNSAPEPLTPLGASTTPFQSSTLMSAAVPALSSAPQAYHPHARTMAEDMALASHGMMGQPATPARSFQTASVPVTFTQPQSQPATLQQSTASMPPPAAASFATLSPAAPVAPINSPANPVPATSSAALPPQPAQPSYAAPPPSAPPVTAPIRLTPVDRFYNGAPIHKEFGSDPYREPIE